MRSLPWLACVGAISCLQACLTSSDEPEDYGNGQASNASATTGSPTGVGPTAVGGATSGSSATTAGGSNQATSTTSGNFGTPSTSTTTSGTSGTNTGAGGASATTATPNGANTGTGGGGTGMGNTSAPFGGNTTGQATGAGSGGDTGTGNGTGGGASGGSASGGSATTGTSSSEDCRVMLGSAPVCCTPLGENRSNVDEVYELLNAYRVSQGRDALARDEVLEEAMQGHCKHMALADFFDHYSIVDELYEPWDRAEYCGTSANAENIAWNQRSPAQVMEAWENSSGHNENMLRTGSSRVGIGEYDLYWGQIFGR